MVFRERLPLSMKRALRLLANRYLDSPFYDLTHAFGNQRLISKAKKSGPLKLHLGCGSHILPGWLNVDKRKYHGAVVLRLPTGLRNFPDNTVSYVYSSHVIEYFGYPTEIATLLKEIHRILVPGGVFRFVVPGIERIIRAYVADDREFFEEQKKHNPGCTTKLEHLMSALHGHEGHKCGYDYETARKVLSQSGFNHITNSDYQKSEVEALRVDYRGQDLSLFVEAVK